MGSKYGSLGTLRIISAWFTYLNAKNLKDGRLKSEGYQGDREKHSKIAVFASCPLLSGGDLIEVTLNYFAVRLVFV